MALSDLPLASGQEHKRVFIELGWVLQSDGNHIVFTHPNHPEVYLSIPNHHEVKRGTLKSIVRAAHLTDQQYAVFFTGNETPAAHPEESEEDLFRETIDSEGTTHILCNKCAQVFCHSKSLDEMAAAKLDHRNQCTGSF